MGPGWERTLALKKRRAVGDTSWSAIESPLPGSFPPPEAGALDMPDPQLQSKPASFRPVRARGSWPLGSELAFCESGLRQIGATARCHQRG